MLPLTLQPWAGENSFLITTMCLLADPTCFWMKGCKLVRSLGSVDKGDSQKGQYLIQGSFWGGYLDPGFDERRGMGLP